MTPREDLHGEPAADLLRDGRFWAAATVGYVVLAVAYFWPLPQRLATGIGHDDGDPLLNTWILAWTASRLPLTRAWWDAPAFAPMSHSLALSEHLLGLWPLSAPLLWAGVPPLVVYNLLLIASLALCGLAACALALHLTNSRSAGIVAGCLYALAPYRLAQLAHLQILASWWGPIALLALHRQAAVGGWRWAIVFAVSWLLLALTSGYHLLFFSIVAAAVGAWLFGRAGVWRRAWPVVAATACAAVLLLPVLRTYGRAHDEQGLTRQPDEIDDYSADVLHLGRTPHLSRWWGNDAPAAYSEIALFPGLALAAGVLLTIGVTAARPRRAADRASVPAWPAWTAGALSLVPLALAATAAGAPGEYVLAGLRVSLTTPAKSLTVAWVLLIAAAGFSAPGRRLLARRGVLALYALVAIGTWLMTLGPRARVGGVTVMYHAPYAWLMALPGGLAMRVPPRFWLWTVLALAMVTAFGVAALRRRAPRAGLVAASLLSAVAIADGWPRQMPVAEVPQPLAWPATGSARVVHLPLGEAVADVAAMWRGRTHGRPVVNGYSGYDPAHYRLLEGALQDGDPGVLQVLAEPGGLLVVLDTTAPDAPVLSGALTAAGAAPAGEDGRWRFATLEARPAPVLPSGHRYAPRRVVGVDGQDVTAETTDDDRYSVWSTGAAQRKGQGVVVEFAVPIEAGAIELRAGAFATDYPARLRVEALVGDVWQAVYDGAPSAAALRATLAAPTDPAMVLRLAPSRSAAYRLTAGADHPTRRWAISRVTLLGTR